ncbi:entericidin A/B family lipoprotein [Burkholderiaceae bacterium DAT-1]|nr:entericidin A/B family lipoprotein [Burkholderiaceae bacterium DAT-1]
MKRKALILMMISAVFGLTACNTMRGIGEDIKKGGEAIEKAAK